VKLNEDNETLAINKVLILYILNKLNKPVTNTGLLKLVLSIDEINYFYFQQFLLDLLENRYLITYKKENSDVYEITEKGKETLNLTLSILPGILKLKVDTSLKESADKIEDEVSIIAEYMPEDEKNYTVTCKIIENGVTVFETKTYAPSPEIAKKITDNWNTKAVELYPKILGLLMQ